MLERKKLNMSADSLLELISDDSALIKNKTENIEIELSLTLKTSDVDTVDKIISKLEDAVAELEADDADEDDEDLESDPEEDEEEE